MSQSLTPSQAAQAEAQHLANIDDVNASVDDLEQQVNSLSRHDLQLGAGQRAGYGLDMKTWFLHKLGCTADESCTGGRRWLHRQRHAAAGGPGTAAVPLRWHPCSEWLQTFSTGKITCLRPNPVIKHAAAGQRSPMTDS